MRREHRYHTDEQVADSIGKAARLVDELEIAGDLRVAAFTAASGLYAQKHIEVAQAPAVPIVAPLRDGQRPR